MTDKESVEPLTPYIQHGHADFVEWNSALKRVLIDVNGECQRQRILQSEGRFKFTCADTGGLSEYEKLAVLVEEVGEVAREALTDPSRPLAVDTTGTMAGLRKELVQVAAVAASWAESLDRSSGKYA